MLRRALLFIILADLLYVTIFSIFISYQAEPQLDGAPYDSAIVFFQGYDLQNRPLKSYQKAIEHAVTLRKNDTVRNIMFVGGNRPSRQVFGSKETAKAVSESGAIPETELFFDTTSFDTQSNWKEVEKLAQKQSWKTLLLIPTPYHIPRLKLLTADSLLTKHFAPTPPNFSPLDREIWFWSHYELVATAAHLLLPNSIYYPLLRWIRGQSD